MKTMTCRQLGGPCDVQHQGDNADAVIKAKPASSKGTYVQRVAISSTQGPGVKVDPSSLTS